MSANNNTIILSYTKRR